MDTEKVAIGVNGVMNTLTAIDGANTMKNAYKDTANKYDGILNTNVVKGNKNMGFGNSNISKRSASQEIDMLIKEAGIKDKASKVLGKAKKYLSDFDTNTTKNIADGINDIKNKNIMSGSKKLGKGVAMATPAVAGIVGSGVGTAKALDKLDDKFNRKANKRDSDRQGRVKIEHKGLGVGLSATLAASALSGKSAYKPAKTLVEAMKNEVVKIPMSKVKRHVPGVGNVIDYANKAGGTLKRNQKAINHYANVMSKMGRNFDGDADKFKLNLVEKTKKDFFAEHTRRGLSENEVKKLWSKSEETLKETINSAFESVKDTLGKKASDDIDFLIEKLAGSKTEYAKRVFKENF